VGPGRGLAWAALLLAGALTAGCVAPQPSDRAACPGLFQQYDRVARMFPHQVYDRSRRDFRFAPELTRLEVLLVQNDCQTRSRDLDRLDAVAGARDGRPIVESGVPLSRPVSIHAGALTSDADAARAVAFFGGVGLQSTSVGNPYLGRRVYAGPVRTMGGLEELLALSAEAGFVGSYPSEFWRF
jgi:hypothetical protein